MTSAEATKKEKMEDQKFQGKEEGDAVASGGEGPSYSAVASGGEAASETEVIPPTPPRQAV